VLKPDRQCTYNVTLRRVLATIMCVCVCVCVYIYICSLGYPACNEHAPYFHLWPAPLYSTFPHYLTKGRIFGKKKVTEPKMYVLFFSTTFVWNIPILRRNEQDKIKKMYFGLHVKYPSFFSDFNEILTFSTDFRNILKYQISWKKSSSGSRVFPFGRIDGRTAGRTEGQTWRS